MNKTYELYIKIQCYPFVLFNMNSEKSKFIKSNMCRFQNYFEGKNIKYRGKTYEIIQPG